MLKSRSINKESAQSEAPNLADCEAVRMGVLRVQPFRESRPEQGDGWSVSVWADSLWRARILGATATFMALLGCIGASYLRQRSRDDLTSVNFDTLVQAVPANARAASFGDVRG